MNAKRNAAAIVGGVGLGMAILAAMPPLAAANDPTGWLLPALAALLGTLCLFRPREPAWVASQVALVGAAIYRLDGFVEPPWGPAVLFVAGALAYAESTHLRVRARRWAEETDASFGDAIWVALRSMIVWILVALAAVVAIMFLVRVIIEYATPSVFADSLERNMGWVYGAALAAAATLIWLSRVPWRPPRGMDATDSATQTVAVGAPAEVPATG